MRVEALEPTDWPDIRRIHAEGIATGLATFETSSPSSWEEWDESHLRTCRLAARDGDTLLGWASLSSVSARCCYGGVGEVSVYVGADSRGRGAGRALLEQLVTESEAAGLWTLQAGIFSENEASLRLHAGCGFRTVGRRERLGQVGGDWKDVILLERRSSVIG